MDLDVLLEDQDCLAQGPGIPGKRCPGRTGWPTSGRFPAEWQTQADQAVRVHVGVGVGVVADCGGGRGPRCPGDRDF